MVICTLIAGRHSYLAVPMAARAGANDVEQINRVSSSLTATVSAALCTALRCPSARLFAGTRLRRSSSGVNTWSTSSTRGHHSTSSTGSGSGAAARGAVGAVPGCCALRHGNILKIQAPNPLPPGRKLGNARFFGVLTATGDAPAEGRDRIASDGSVIDAYDPSDDDGPDDDDDSGNAASAADRRREDQRRLVYAAVMSRQRAM